MPLPSAVSDREYPVPTLPTCRWMPSSNMVIVANILWKMQPLTVPMSRQTKDQSAVCYFNDVQYVFIW